MVRSVCDSGCKTFLVCGLINSTLTHAVEMLATLTFKWSASQGYRIPSHSPNSPPPKDLSKAQGLKGHLYQQRSFWKVLGPETLYNSDGSCEDVISRFCLLGAGNLSLTTAIISEYGFPRGHTRGRLTLRSLSHPSPPSPGSMWGTGYYHWLNSQTQVGNGSPHELYLSTTGMHSKNQAVIAPYQRCFGSWHSSGVLLFWVVGRDMKWAVCRQVRQLHVHPGRSPCLNVRWQKEIKRVDLLKWCQLMLTPPKGRCLCSFSVLSNVFQVSSVQCPVCGMILLFEYTIAKGGKKAWTKQLN